MSLTQHVTITSLLSELDNMEYREMQKIAKQLKLKANGKIEKLRSRIRTQLENQKTKKGKTPMTKEEVEMETLLKDVEKKFMHEKTPEDIAVTLQEMSEQCQLLLRMVTALKLTNTVYKDTAEKWAKRAGNPLSYFKSYIDKHNYDDIVVTIYELFASIHYFKKKLNNILF